MPHRAKSKIFCIFIKTKKLNQMKKLQKEIRKLQFELNYAKLEVKKLELINKNLSYELIGESSKKAFESIFDKSILKNTTNIRDKCNFEIGIENRTLIGNLTYEGLGVYSFKGREKLND